MGMLDPDLVARFTGNAAKWLTDLSGTGTGAAVLEMEPHPHVMVPGPRLAGEVFGDLADLKSPYFAGHSRAVAALAAAAAAGQLGLPEGTAAGLEVAGPAPVRHPARHVFRTVSRRRLRSAALASCDRRLAGRRCRQRERRAPAPGCFLSPVWAANGGKLGEGLHGAHRVSVLSGVLSGPRWAAAASALAWLTAA